MNQYSGRVLDALAIEKPIESIAAVKDVVAAGEVRILASTHA